MRRNLSDAAPVRWDLIEAPRGIRISANSVPGASFSGNSVYEMTNIPSGPERKYRIACAPEWQTSSCQGPFILQAGSRLVRACFVLHTETRRFMHELELGLQLSA